MVNNELKPIHPFPARMAPSIVWERLKEEVCSRRVLDPMTGSGTTLIASSALGHSGVGFDSDPLAVIISRAWCAKTPKDTFVATAAAVQEQAKELLWDMDGNGSVNASFDAETKEFAEFWFDKTARRQLSALATAICFAECDEEEKAMLWCSFSRLIITKEKGASLAMDVSHSRPHRVYTECPVKPIEAFSKSVALVASRKYVGTTHQGSSAVALGDARSLPLADCSIDLIITSPPYLNAIDYLRGHRLSLIWMGHSIPDLRRLRSGNIGTERGLTEKEVAASSFVNETLDKLDPDRMFKARERQMLARYILDIDSAVGEAARVLVHGGNALYVVGDSNLKGTFIENSSIVKIAGERHGLHCASSTRRSIPCNRRYLPPPSSSKSGKQLTTRMAEEVVLSFSKPLAG